MIYRTEPTTEASNMPAYTGPLYAVRRTYGEQSRTRYYMDRASAHRAHERFNRGLDRSELFCRDAADGWTLVTEYDQHTHGA